MMKMRGLLLVWSILVLAPACVQASEAESKPSVFEGHLGESVWALVWFAVLLVVLWRFAWKPLLSGLTSRQEYIEKQIADAERTRTEARKVLDEYGAKMADAERQGRLIISERVKDAEKLAREVQQKSQAEIEQMKTRAQADLDRERIEAEEQLWMQAGEIVLRLGTEVFSKNLDDMDNRKLIEEAIARLKEQPSQRMK
jgi:F-type H+-transporting ATPase subunit b